MSEQQVLTPAKLNVHSQRDLFILLITWLRQEQLSADVLQSKSQKRRKIQRINTVVKSPFNEVASLQA